MIVNDDCLSAMRRMADNSVDLIATDPPYFKVKGEAWDRQWDKPADFLAWLGEIADEWVRILKPNGSLYCFASPQMAARVEVMLGERFNVLNHIVWQKPGENIERRHIAQVVDSGAARSYLPANERCIFAEHYGADNMAKGEAGYAAKCDELRGFLFEPLRAYLAGEWERAGLTPKQANAATGSQMAGHYFTRSQWALPTREKYECLREMANATGGDYLKREYDYLKREYDYLKREYDDLKREYDDLKREYDALRRPFEVSADVPYTDVWTFKTVQAYKGKHVCEKPLDMMTHIISASSKPGAVVLDCFMGSGSTGEAAVRLGREFIGIEMDPEWCAKAEHRIKQAAAQLDMWAA